jgi:hypothetical protein
MYVLVFTSACLQVNTCCELNIVVGFRLHLASVASIQHCTERSAVSRIKKIMRMDAELGIMSQDGVFCIGKATV